MLPKDLIQGKKRENTVWDFLDLSYFFFLKEIRSYCVMLYVSRIFNFQRMANMWAQADTILKTVNVSIGVNSFLVGKILVSAKNEVREDGMENDDVADTGTPCLTTHQRKKKIP